MNGIARKLVAETLGTFVLVFVGTGAIVVNTLNQNAVSLVGIALTFGLIVLAMIYAIGDISGCHINPAVSLGFFAARRFPGRLVVPYIACQCIGAAIASSLLRFLFPNVDGLGGTAPSGSAMQSFIVETVMTFILMFVVLRVATGSKEKGIMAGVAIGAVIAFEILFAGPISGASMNPARSLGPALVARSFSSLWIYLTAPFLGAILAVVAWHCIREKEGSPQS